LRWAEKEWRELDTQIDRESELQVTEELDVEDQTETDLGADTLVEANS
jgi:hypothetical protein